MHEQSAEYQERRRKEESAANIVLATIGLIGLVVVALCLSAWGDAMYGSWKCGFVECRVVSAVPR